MNFWVGETRTEPSEGTVAINLLLSWLIKLYMYVCLKPPGPHKEKKESQGRRRHSAVQTCIDKKIL